MLANYNSYQQNSQSQQAYHAPQNINQNINIDYNTNVHLNNAPQIQTEYQTNSIYNLNYTYSTINQSNNSIQTQIQHNINPTPDSLFPPHKFNLQQNYLIINSPSTSLRNLQIQSPMVINKSKRKAEEETHVAPTKKVELLNLIKKEKKL